MGRTWEHSPDVVLRAAGLRRSKAAEALAVECVRCGEPTTLDADGDLCSACVELAPPRRLGR